MKRNMMKAALMSSILAASMVIAPVSVMATDVTPTLSTTQPTIEKTVNVAEGVTVPSNVTFKITQTTNADGMISPKEDIAVPDVTVATASGTSATGTLVKTATTAIPAFTSADAGEYTFKVVEDIDSLTAADGFGWTSTDSNDFYIHVYVSSDGTTEYSVTDSNNAADTTKLGKMTFTNTYTKSTSLSVSKAVVNSEYVDLNKEYDFNIRFTKASTTADDATITVPTGVTFTDAGGTEVTSLAYDTVYHFQMKKDDSVTFNNLPAGTKYSFSETTTPANATVTYSTVSNGGAATAVAPSSSLIGEGTNTCAVTNTYQKVTPTGVVTSIAPFIALIIAVVAGIFLYAGVKRKVRR
ncbi:MAG: hypothetical protein VZR02_00335 [Lachnospiraceae bacterium]|nr:hypothetical protein [Lachnospiraceae bacterium]